MVAVVAFVAWAVWGPAPALSYALIAAVPPDNVAVPIWVPSKKITVPVGELPVTGPPLSTHTSSQRSIRG